MVAAARFPVDPRYQASWDQWTGKARADLDRRLAALTRAHPELTAGDFARYRARIEALWEAQAA